MKVGILLYPNCSLWSATGSYELLCRANKAWQFFHGNNSRCKKFEVDFVAPNKDEIKTSFPFPIQAKYSINKHPGFDLIIIPGFESEPDKVLKESGLTANWIAEQNRAGVKIASICTGSVLMAKSGLLENKTATTHWVLKDFFQANFPEISLDLSKIVIDYGNLMMSGSATSFQNLILIIIEQFMGRTVAVGVSKMYLIDINKDRPDSYMDLVLGKKHNDEEIYNAQNFIKRNFNVKISLDDIAQKVQMTKRTFIRRFKKATNDTPLNYIHKVKVEKAKQMLENERKTFEEIAFQLAYEDVNAFRKIFVRQTGISPMKYRARYQVI